MRPFKMFFGLAIGIILFLFVARVVFFAFIIAAVMSLAYALVRRFKDFITYDRFGRPYMQPQYRYSSINEDWDAGPEPLFYERPSNHQRPDRYEQRIHVV